MPHCPERIQRWQCLEHSMQHVPVSMIPAVMRPILRYRFMTRFSMSYTCVELVLLFNDMLTNLMEINWPFEAWYQMLNGYMKLGFEWQETVVVSMYPWFQRRGTMVLELIEKVGFTINDWIYMEIAVLAESVIISSNEQARLHEFEDIRRFLFDAQIDEEITTDEEDFSSVESL